MLRGQVVMIATPRERPGLQPATRQSHRWLRIILAGPIASTASIVIMSGAALWIAPGPAGVDHVLLPLLSFPAIWIILFLHACLDRRLARAYAIQGALLLGHAALIARQVL